ncbi:hypothetical protein EZS27_043437, partial [termite gut metagenome]
MAGIGFYALHGLEMLTGESV